MSGSNSISEGWRQKGNEKFTAAHVYGVIVDIRLPRMSDAINLYNKAYTTAENNDEKASAAKNLGLSNWKMVDFQKQDYAPASMIQYYYKEAIKYFDLARHFGQMAKSFDWQQQVLGKGITCMEAAIKQNETATYRERAAELEQYTNCMMDSTYKAEYYLEIANLVFREGINALQNGDYKTALNNMKECHRPIHEARKMAGKNEHLHTELNVLEADCHLHACTAESVQARNIGDGILDNILKQEEVLLMTGVYEVIDWYKKAILLSREIDVEMEAIANSRIGVVFDKVLKSKSKAHSYFKKSIDLAHTLSPRNFGSEEWFKKATEVLQRYQDEVVEQEAEKWTKEREKYVKEQETEIKLLQTKIDAGVKPFIQHIYKTHPPKKETDKLEEPNEWKSDAFKNILKKALIHYHPDRQKQYGEKWLVMCEEIVKILTNKYESFKFED